MLWAFSAVGKSDTEMSRGLRYQFLEQNEAPGEEVMGLKGGIFGG